MLSRGSHAALKSAFSLAVTLNCESVNSVHLFVSLLDNPEVKEVLSNCTFEVNNLKGELSDVLGIRDDESSTNKKVEKPIASLKPSRDLCEIVRNSVISAHSEGVFEVTPPRLLNSLFSSSESFDLRKLIPEKDNGLDLLNLASAISAWEERKKLGNCKQQFGNYVFDKVSDEKYKKLGNKFLPNFQVSNNTSEDPLLSYCINLSEQVRQGMIDLVVGREDLIDRTVKILSRRRKNNPLYVGEPGVGKSALVDGLAVKIVSGEIPELQGTDIYSLDMASLVAGTRYRGDFEERIKSLIGAVTARKNVILFIDEIHLIVGAGATTGGSLDAGNLLKPALSRGLLRCIGATTCKEYSTGFEKDPALVRRFQKIDVNESSLDETIEVLKGIKHYYEDFHGVIYSTASIKLIAELADKRITGQMMPDKAVSLMDDVGVFVKFSSDNGSKKVHTSDVRKVTNIIIGKNLSCESCDKVSFIDKVHKELHKHVVGQEEAILLLINALKISFVGLRSHDRPLLSALFVGPTGVGKTSVINHLARVMDMKLIRFDMSEYSESHSVSKIIGSPPGYVGYDSGGMLTAEVFKNPHSIVLLDEMEKAHKDVYNLFLQVMDYGWMHDAFGRKVDFRNTIIIMTSNIGVSESFSLSYGFESKAGDVSLEKIKKSMEKTFSPEFRGRLDTIIFFNSIEKEGVMKVIDKFASEFSENLLKHGVQLVLEDSAVEYMASSIYQKASGIRSIESFFRNELSSEIADICLSMQKNAKVIVKAFSKDGKNLEYEKVA